MFSNKNLTIDSHYSVWKWLHTEKAEAAAATHGQQELQLLALFLFSFCLSWILWLSSKVKWNCKTFDQDLFLSRLWTDYKRGMKIQDTTGKKSFLITKKRFSNISYSGASQNSGGKEDPAMFIINSLTSSPPMPGRDWLDGHRMCPRVDISSRTTPRLMFSLSTNRAQCCWTSAIIWVVIYPMW